MFGLNHVRKFVANNYRRGKEPAWVHCPHWECKHTVKWAITANRTFFGGYSKQLLLQNQRSSKSVSLRRTAEMTIKFTSFSQFAFPMLRDGIQLHSCTGHQRVHNYYCSYYYRWHIRTNCGNRQQCDCRVPEAELTYSVGPDKRNISDRFACNCQNPLTSI